MRTLSFANIWLVIVLILAGCASTPYSKQIATGYDIAGDYLARTEKLYDAKMITKAEAQERLNQVKSATAALDIAKTAFAACSVNKTPDNKCLTSDGKLASAVVSGARLTLNSVETYLIAQEGAK
jgi:hypothetical protein